MFGITAGGGAVGALAAPALLRRFSPYHLIATVAWVALVATALLVPAGSPYVIGALGAAAFLFAPAVNALAFGLIAWDAPDRMQGRATSSESRLRA